MTRAAKPLTQATIDTFRNAQRIARTGCGPKGERYSVEGMLNQAAWAGEHCLVLIDEIERQRAEIAELKIKLRSVVTRMRSF